MSQTTTMYATYGWQNVAERAEHNQPISVRKMEVPNEHAHCVMDYTHAREFSVAELIAALEEKTGVTGLTYEMERD